MPTIPDDLKSFKNSVDNNIETMNSKITDISTKLTELKNSSSTASSGFSAYYNSKNKDKILNKFTKVGEILTTINDSVGQDLKSMVSKADEILQKVKRMETLNIEIEEQDAIINSEDAKANDNDDTTVPDYGARSTAVSVKTNDEREFNTLLTDATNMLTALKGMDGNLAFVSSFTSTDYLSYLDALQYGTFEQESFTASNGVTVNYYIYIPDYGQDVEGLPIHLYLHGSGESGSRVLACGLPKLISEQSITPSGIVICPQAPSTSEFYQAGYQDAMLELCTTVAEEHNGDTNRISMSGHSMGAIVGYKMIARYPEFFSAFVPISGLCYCRDDIAESDTAIWIFHGSGDSTCEYSNAKHLYEYLDNEGYDIQMHTFSGAGHGGVQNKTFEEEYEDADGEMINPLEWAFKQVKGEA